ncbi:MAG: hypothetical protein QM820_01870 [Minicystis sp.]
MTPMRRPAGKPARYGWIRAVVAVLGLSTLVAGGGLREDELECEQAVAHLQSCCPGFETAQIRCVYSDTCSLTLPALSIAESECIMKRSCDEIIASKLCEATQDSESPHENFDGEFVAHALVCQ